MKKITKVFAMIAGIIAVIGIVMCIAGLAMGVNLKDGLSYFKYKSHVSFGMEDIDEVFVSKDIEDLEIKSKIGHIELKVYDGDTIKVTGKAASKVEMSVKGNKFKYEDTSENVIGSKHNEDDYKIEILIPANIELKEVEIEVGAGEFLSDGIRVTKELEASVGAGHMEFSNAKVEDIKMECGVGQFTYSGTINGNADVSGGIGQIVFNLEQPENDFNYEADNGIGEISLNNNSFASLAKDMKIDNNAPRDFKVDCGVGAIEINTK